MEELDPLCDQFQEIILKDTFYDNLYMLCKYVDEESVGDENGTAVALEKIHNDPDYKDNCYKMWLYNTIIQWHKIIQASAKFTVYEESCAIYLMRAITEIARTAICYDGCNILSELKNIITNSFTEYTNTGFQYLCSEHTFEMLIRSRTSIRTVVSSEFVPEFEAEDEQMSENYLEEKREYEAKCQILIDIATEFLSSKFTMTIVKLAAQKFVDRVLTLQSDFVFNAPKTYHQWVEPPKQKHVDKKKSKDKKLAEQEVLSPKESEVNLRDLYEIFPSRMSLEANSDEFWDGLVKKYTEQKDEKIENASADNESVDTKKPKKSKKGKKVQT